MKKAVSLFLVFALVLSLVALSGCGDKKNTPIAGSGANVGLSDSEEEFFMDMPSELKGTTVKYATWSDGGPSVGFEQTTGMKMEIVTVPQGDYINKLIGLIAADQAPDVVIENSDFPRTLQVLMPLTKENTGMDVTDPFWDQNIVKLYTVGKYPYLVQGTNTWSRVGAVTYFNRTMLEESGIKTPTDYVAENNWTLETFRKLMTQINESCGLSRSGTVIDVHHFLTLFGAQEVSYNSDTNKFSNGTNSPELLKGVQWLVKAKDDGLCELMLEGSHNSLSNGTAAMQVAGSYGLRTKPGWFYDMDVDDLGFAPLPKMDASEEFYPVTSSVGAYGICAGSKNPKGAAYLLRYMLNDDVSDPTDVFKNKEAEDLFMESLKHINYNYADFNRGVRLCYNPDLGSLTAGLMGQVIWTSTSQISVKLSAASNEIEAAVAKANSLVEEIIAEQ